MSHPRPPISFEEEIRRAIEEPDPAISNLKITRVHYLLSEALQSATGGPQVGANFHSWAVWGSRKAGVTIRQEDLDSALRDASRVAGIVGGFVGLLAERRIARRRSSWMVDLVGIALGSACGAFAGRGIATYGRGAASARILAGNRTVLQDIGMQTARFLATFADKDEPDAKLLDTFLAGFETSGPNGEGQALLKEAFAQYYRARYSNDLKEQHEALYFGNCLAVYHEHIRLQPYIKDSMPWIIRKCVTKRMMTFDVGCLRLAVSQSIGGESDEEYPPTLTMLDDSKLRAFLGEFVEVIDGQRQNGSASAADWTRIDQRMRYIFRLFRTYQAEHEVCRMPYTSGEMKRIAKADTRVAPASYATLISPVKTSVAAPVIYT